MELKMNFTINVTTNQIGLYSIGLHQKCQPTRLLLRKKYRNATIRTTNNTTAN